MPRQRIFRVPLMEEIPEGWRFVQWIGKESLMWAPYWCDVVLCETTETQEEIDLEAGDDAIGRSIGI